MNTGPCGSDLETSLDRHRFIESGMLEFPKISE